MLPPIVVDLFAGAGGLSLGFKKAGFNIITAYEIHKDAIKTYERNHEEVLIKQKNIRELTGKEVLKDSKRKKIDVLIGGPPCQGFSMYGKKNFNDERNNLILEYIRLVKEVKPEIFVMENVPGLFKLYEGRSWENIVEKLKSIDYEISAQVLRAADYGVPQLRERLIVIGTKYNNPIVFPPSSKGHKVTKDLYIEHVKKPKFFLDYKPMERDITMKEALNDLKFLGPGEISDRYYDKPDSEFQKILRKSQKTLYNHQAVQHSKRTIKRFKLMKPGKGNDSLPKKLQTNRKSTKKLVPSQLCRTVTSSPEDFVHYSQPRILTMREIARLQTFPDNYEFLGPRTTGGQQRQISCVQSQQLGNAVPPFLAQAVAEGIAKMLNFKTTDKLSNHLDTLNQLQNTN